MNETLDFFIAGGTLPADAPSYVERPADEELFRLTLAGELCYVLTARQMGKSSLMVRTARRLQAHGVRTAIVDLSEIGTGVTIEQWYLGVLTGLKSQLKLSVDLEAWWQERAFLGAVQRFTDFLREVVLSEIEEPVVIFVDEIDTTLKLDFSDDFFAAIRALHNARATDPTYERLTFVLLGVATPADLIRDRRRTPFNIGQGIDLQEFSREDARGLQQGLQAVCPTQGEALFDRIFYWTGGHPYLTQKLCREVVHSGNEGWTVEEVDTLVKKLFLSEGARKETNLQFVRDSLLTNPHRRRLLILYRKVYEGEDVTEDEQSFDQNRLKLYGLVRSEGGMLKVRNEIYRRVFDREWIEAHLPVDWTRRIVIVSALLALLLLGAILYAQQQQQQRVNEALAKTLTQDFKENDSPEVRIASLAKLFDLSGYEEQARHLFEELPPEEQRALFRQLKDPQSVGPQLIAVVSELYTDPVVGAQEELLDAMAYALDRLDRDDPQVRNLASEIRAWVEGRKRYGQDEPRRAIEAYNMAIRLNGDNPGTYLDRARAYAALQQYKDALQDLEQVARLDERWTPAIRKVLEEYPTLHAVWAAHQDAYPALRRVLTSTPTPS